MYHRFQIKANNMAQDLLINTLQREALRYLQDNLNSIYHYHNAEHTLNVCTMIAEFSENCILPENEIAALKIAAIFHDFGYLESAFDNEGLALPFMMEFCKKYGVEEKVSHRAGELIMETAFPYHPVSAAGELLCDADIEYIGRVCFFEKAGLFRQEMSALNHIYSDQQWWKLELDFLQNNQFFSTVCREKRSAGRLANIAKVKAILAAMKQE